jgi:DNA polymerase III delta prime subunit
MSAFATLFDHDFELLVADLLGARERCEYEVFARGQDLGIDLRRRDRHGALEVVQVKHFERSRFADLARAARDERVKLEQLDPQPDRYRFATSMALTVEQKDKLVAILDPYVKKTADVLGETELELRLRQHPEVERRHPKLWLRGSGQLLDMVHADVRSRSRSLLARIERQLPVYVRHRGFDDARRRLHEQRVLVVAGPPGVGKTTLAEMLVLDALRSREYDEPIAVSRNVEEAWRVLDPERRQIILYDDFLGRAALQRLDKNEGGSLVELMCTVNEAPHTLFLLTTREYILREAEQLDQELHRLVAHRMLLELRDYDLLDRAEIFVSHARHAGLLPARAREALLNSDSYMRILTHPNYTPRTISYITGSAGPALDAEELEDYVAFALATLEDPARLWSRVFRSELGVNERALLLALACSPGAMREAELLDVYGRVAEHTGAEGGAEAFHQALRTLDGSMVETSTWTDLSNPSAPFVSIAFRDGALVDYLLEHITNTPQSAIACLHAAPTFGAVDQLLAETGLTQLPGVSASIAEAVERTYPLTTAGMPSGALPHPASRLASYRTPYDPARRLLRVREAMQDNEELAGLLGEWWQERLSELVAQLDDGDYSPWGMPLELVSTARKDLERIPGARDALKRAFTQDQSPSGWLHLTNFHALWPKAFTRREWQQVREDFTAWLAASPPQGEEVTLAVTAAERLGVSPPESLLARARTFDDDWKRRVELQFASYEPRPANRQQLQARELFAGLARNQGERGEDQPAGSSPADS